MTEKKKPSSPYMIHAMLEVKTDEGIKFVAIEAKKKAELFSQIGTYADAKVLSVVRGRKANIEQKVTYKI